MMKEENKKIEEYKKMKEEYAFVRRMVSPNFSMFGTSDEGISKKLDDFEISLRPYEEGRARKLGRAAGRFRDPKADFTEQLEEIEKAFREWKETTSTPIRIFETEWAKRMRGDPQGLRALRFMTRSLWDDYNFFENLLEKRIKKIKERTKKVIQEFDY